MSKNQKIPEGSVWQLRGCTSGAVLHDDVSAAEAPHLLRGDTDVPLLAVPVGGSTGIEFDGERRRLRFELVRKS